MNDRGVDMGQRVDIIVKQTDGLQAVYIGGYRVGGSKPSPYAADVVVRPTTWQRITDAIPTNVLREALRRRAADQPEEDQDE